MMTIKCAVYRSNKKDLTYLYLPEKDEEDFSVVPEALRNMLGMLEYVMSFNLTEDRTLAQEDPVVVLKQIQDQGWFLQMPKQDLPEVLS